MPQKRSFPVQEEILHLAVACLITVPALIWGKILRMLKGRRFGPLPSPAETRAVLILEAENLGDMLLTAGFLRQVRKIYPKARITLVVNKAFRSFAAQCPYVDEVLGFDQSGSKYVRVFKGPIRAFLFSKRELWKRHFDLAINPRWDVDSRHGSLIGLFSMAGSHAGFSSGSNPRKKVVNRFLDGAFSYTHASAQLTHEAMRGHELLQALGLNQGRPACEVWITPADQDYSRSHLKSFLDDGEILVALALGASNPWRRWPSERFAEVTLWMLDRWPSLRFVSVGDANDAAAAEAMRPQLGDKLLNFAGKCSIGQSAALMSLCEAYIGTDSGPMHMAAGVGMDIVSVNCHPLTAPDYHAHSPARYAPFGVKWKSVRPADFTPPCAYDSCTVPEPHCLLQVAPADVIAAVQEIFGARLDAIQKRRTLRSTKDDIYAA